MQQVSVPHYHAPCLPVRVSLQRNASAHVRFCRHRQTYIQKKRSQMMCTCTGTFFYFNTHLDILGNIGNSRLALCEFQQQLRFIHIQRIGSSLKTEQMVVRKFAARDKPGQASKNTSNLQQEHWWISSELFSLLNVSKNSTLFLPSEV